MYNIFLVFFTFLLVTFGKINNSVQAPLSPYLTIYKPQIGSFLSILVRVSGSFVFFFLFIYMFLLIFFQSFHFIGLVHFFFFLKFFFYLNVIVIVLLQAFKYGFFSVFFFFLYYHIISGIINLIKEQFVELFERKYLIMLFGLILVVTWIFFFCSLPFMYLFI